MSKHHSYSRQFVLTENKLKNYLQRIQLISLQRKKIMAKKNRLKKLFVNIRKGNIPWYLKNRYLLLSYVFVLWMTFFDRNNFIEQYRLRSHLGELKAKRDYFAEQIKVVKQERQELFTNAESLGKFAREQYMMKRPNEDVFVMVPAKKEE